MRIRNRGPANGRSFSGWSRITQGQPGPGRSARPPRGARWGGPPPPRREGRGWSRRGRGEPLWWTLRRPFAPLAYDAARMTFTRVNRMLGANWTLHDLRHSAAKRMIRDPHLTLADVQWVLGHAHLTTTEIYTATSS